ncbi:T9SS type A sorting domain-containing protein [Lutibacter sp. B1]|uniref:T9SS type A sorting domain-containing protein n=1 Tax=Lutibacter sp. B1 TaxID=2725996 RepID=UPI001456B576|nr:T9SS type A sorting domain-containing protein [Lutibacter sp. B1]NLP58185.1 T9SS type A sorting domain-containing protein [Lutibacter sp. B1]
MKKLLLITFLLLFTYSFAQQKEKNIQADDTKPPVTLSSISAYPNPFSVNTSINFNSTKVQHIEFTVKNLLGKTVYKELINSKSGYNTIQFNRNDLSKGMYIYTLQTESEIVSKRLVIR